jgi:putative MATE family efflux protein
MIVTNTLMMLGPTIDMIWVGKLGPAALAGVGVAGIAVMLLNSMLMGLAQGMRAVISRFVGSHNLEGAGNAALQSFYICAVFSVIMALVGMFFSESILILLGLEADVVAEGSVYMRIIFTGSISMSFRMLIDSIMQASGDSINPMKITLIYRILHIALCPFLIFGWWIFPEMGVAGAGLTNVISQTLGTGIGIWYLCSGRTRLKLSFRRLKLDFAMMGRIFKVGLPALVSGLQRNASQAIMMWIVAPFGTIAVAAHSLNQRIEMIVIMPVMALGMAAGVLAGQNLGAGHTERAEKSTWLAVFMVEGIMIVVCIFILVAAEMLVRIFSPDLELIEMGATYLRIAVAGYLLLGFAPVLMNALSGSGDTVPPMVVSIITALLVTLPGAYFLSKIPSLGVFGVRWAMAAEVVVQAIIFTIYFRTGKWKTRHV